MIEKHIVLEDVDPVAFYGVNNVHIQMIKALYPKLRIVARGNVIRAMGDEEELAHFEETVSDTEIHFDYKLKPGPAETRNAIHLLKLMGFDDDIVSAAHSRADHYVKTGKWSG
jgi:hypothetical protein